MCCPGRIEERERTGSPWKELLANPAPNGHLVQLYQDVDFCAEAISHFSAAGIEKGESVVIVATAPNWARVANRLIGKGFNSADLLRQGQLILIDAEVALGTFLVDEMPDPDAFKAFATSTIKQARADGKFERVRWWGEMVNLLYVAGNQSGSTRLDELFDGVGNEQSIAILHSFLMDKYDPTIYDRTFNALCRIHEHVIPAEDYALHRTVVDRVVSEIIGPIDGPLLRSLVSWAHAHTVGMPTSQSILLWVKDAVPAKFDEVLARARMYEAEALHATSR